MCKGGAKNINRADYIAPDVYKKIRPYLTTGNALTLDVCACTGCRICDVLKLAPKDILYAKNHNGWLDVVEQKTGKTRAVHLDSNLIGRLLFYTGSQWVFYSPFDEFKHRTRQAVWGQLTAVCRRYGITGVYTPHSMRKQYAVCLYAKTHDLRAVQRAMCHDKIETTMLYAYSDMLTQERLKNE